MPRTNEDAAEINEERVLKLKDGTPATQYVFGLRNAFDDEDDDIGLVHNSKKLEDRVSVRDAERPNTKLPLLEVDRSTGKSAAKERTVA